MERVIPSKEIRLAVYKHALRVIESEIGVKELSIDPDDGLCLILPCLWLNMSYNEVWRDAGGNYFDWPKTQIYFPEFGEWYANKAYRRDREWRIYVLNKIIAGMEK